MVINAIGIDLLSTMPKVSVIIPTYNRMKYVTRAVESVLAQTYKDYEVIVVDDGSNDNTQQNLKGYQDKIKYIYQDNSGVSAARNTGIKFAKGEWLAFLDSDDEWMPDYLLTQIENAERVPEICMQTTDCLVTELNGKRKSYFEINGSSREFKGKSYLFIEKPFNFIIKHGPWQVGSTIILRESITKTGLFDTSLRISEDLDLMARVALQGSFGMIRKVLVNVYRRNETTQCLTGQVEKNPMGVRESHERMYEKLKRIEQLGQNEIRTLNDLLSSNRRAIGNLLVKDRKIKEARQNYKRAFFISPSLASICKYMFSFLPTKFHLLLIERKVKIRENG